MAGAPKSISDLQAKWSKLPNLDRALAVHAIHKAGTSFRELAKALDCSESLLRHLDQAAQAPRVDLLLARKGTVSIRELVRRSKAASLKRSASQRGELEAKRAKEAATGCRLICKWLEEEGLKKGYGEAIILEARRMLAEADHKVKFPKHPAPPGIKPAEIIRLAAPSQALRDTLDLTTLYAAWLARWACYAFPDVWVRDQALHLALGEQPKRWTPPRRHPLALDPGDRRIN
jgi:hypothetical protein